MDLGQAFSYVNKDEKWLAKIGIGGLLNIVPILGTITTLGFLVGTARNVARGNTTTPMPDWSDFSEIAGRGVKALVIYLVYLVPAIVLVFLSNCVVAAMSTNDSMAGIAALLSLLISLLTIVADVVGITLGIAGIVRYIQTDDLNGSLKFQEIIQTVTGAPGIWIKLFLIAVLCSIVGALGGIACGIGALFTGFYAMGAVFGHVLGQHIAETTGGMGGMGMGGGMGGSGMSTGIPSLGGSTSVSPTDSGTPPPSIPSF